jgi:hypothetical protein
MKRHPRSFENCYGTADLANASQRAYSAGVARALFNRPAKLSKAYSSVERRQYMLGYVSIVAGGA